MSIAAREPDLGEVEREKAEQAHRFAAEVMRPAGRRLDALDDPAQVIAPGSELWGVFEQYRAHEFDLVSLVSAGLPPDRQALLCCLVHEELGWGDAGLAIGLGVAVYPRVLALASGDADLWERFGGSSQIGCWPVTEPHHGSDLISLVAGRRDIPLPTEPDCIARRDGDDYVISGQKSTWVSNGTIADAAALFCIVDQGDGPAGMGAFVVALDEPGVSRGKPLDKFGQRALNQGEIHFDHVRVPARQLVVEPGDPAATTWLAQGNAMMGSTFVGTAQAAFDLALAYAHQRVQGGAPIIRHQSVKARMFTMFRKVEAARALSRRAMVLNPLDRPDLAIAVASKVTATQTAFEVASDALQIFGGRGVSREYPIEKLLRDARVSMIEDGCNEVLSLAAADLLRPEDGMSPA